MEIGERVLLVRIQEMLVALMRHTVPASDPARQKMEAWVQKREERKITEARRPPVLGYRLCDVCKNRQLRRCYQMPCGRAMCLTCRRETKKERGWV